MNNINKISDSPLFQKIADQIDAYKNEVNVIYVSISENGENYSLKKGKEPIWIKWLAWSLIDRSNELLFESDLIMVHGDLAEDQLRIDLIKFFETYTIFIDNEIHFDQ